MTMTVMTQAGALGLSRSAQNGLLSATSLGVVTTNNAYTGFSDLSHFSASSGARPLYDAQYTYDSLGGELTTKAVGSQTTTYSYDALGNLITVRFPNGAEIDYVVDGRKSTRRNESERDHGSGLPICRQPAIYR